MQVAGGFIPIVLEASLQAYTIEYRQA